MKNLLLILLLFFGTHCMYAMGFGDWIHHTSTGSSIEDPGGGVRLLTSTNNTLENLERWYFYNDHVIGEYDTFINPAYVKAYFILNELNGELKTYTIKELFEKDIQAKELQPLFWTRWYYDHFTLILGIYILWAFYWPIMSCIVLFIGLLISLSITLKNKFFKISCIVLTATFLLPPLLFMLGDYCTTSI